MISNIRVAPASAVMPVGSNGGDTDHAGADEIEAAQAADETLRLGC